MYRTSFWWVHCPFPCDVFAVSWPGTPLLVPSDNYSKRGTCSALGENNKNNGVWTMRQHLSEFSWVEWMVIQTWNNQRMINENILASGKRTRGFHQTFWRVRVHRHQHLTRWIGFMENRGIGTASDWSRPKSQGLDWRASWAEMKSIRMNAWEEIQHWLRIGCDDVVICHDLAQHGVINHYRETRWQVNDECGDVGDDEDGDGRLVWEEILGSIRTDQFLRRTLIGSFQASIITILLLYQCLLTGGRGGFTQWVNWGFFERF